jgi:hypothetical protein
MKYLRKIYTPAILSCFMLCLSCSDASKEVEERERNPGEAITALNVWSDHNDAIPINLDPTVQYQVMDNFGASDAWSVQHVGTWPEAKRSQMADWLFSTDTLENGQPVGIGLNAWRFNIGAGSAEQGDQSMIDNPWRRAQCFLNADGSYNWEKQEGQRWFLEAAAERGVDRFIGFTNSPPVHYTKNGLAHGDESSPVNIAEENFTVFSEFLLEVTRGIKESTGVEFTHLSPFNEPQWDWTDNNQEGCHLGNVLAGKLVLALNQELEGASDLNTNIIISEAGEWDYLYGKGDETGNQVDFFFGSGNSLQEASRLEHIITGHSYYTTHPPSTLISTREAVWNKVSDYPGLQVWCTEYCPLGNADLKQLGWSNWRKDLGMQVALHVGRILHHDLTYARVSAWQWWLAISDSNYPDGLIYVNGSNSDGNFSDSKLMWTIGNYSRFIEPGSIRIDADCSADGLMVSAFTNPETQQLTVVVLNNSDQSHIAAIDVVGIELKSLRPYITSDFVEHDLFPLMEIDAGDAFEIPAKCALTFTALMNP